GHKLCTKSREVSFRSIFHAPSRNFKILAIPSILTHEKLYVHGLTKKRDAHKFCTKSHAKSRFDWFFMQRLEILKYSSFPTY
ncbi:hypothetical protein GW17_00043801, partial [Ensete ventricosum]